MTSKTTAQALLRAQPGDSVPTVFVVEPAPPAANPPPTLAQQLTASQYWTREGPPYHYPIAGDFDGDEGREALFAPPARPGRPVMSASLAREFAEIEARQRAPPPVCRVTVLGDGPPRASDGPLAAFGAGGAKARFVPGDVSLVLSPPGSDVRGAGSLTISGGGAATSHILPPGPSAGPLVAKALKFSPDARFVGLALAAGRGGNSTYVLAVFDRLRAEYCAFPQRQRAGKSPHYLALGRVLGQWSFAAAPVVMFESHEQGLVVFVPLLGDAGSAPPVWAATSEGVYLAGQVVVVADPAAAPPAWEGAFAVAPGVEPPPQDWTVAPAGAERSAGRVIASSWPTASGAPETWLAQLSGGVVRCWRYEESRGGWPGAEVATLDAAAAGRPAEGLAFEAFAWAEQGGRLFFAVSVVASAEAAPAEGAVASAEGGAADKARIVLVFGWTPGEAAVLVRRRETPIVRFGRARNDYSERLFQLHLEPDGGPGTE